MNQKKIKDTAKKHAPESHYVKNEVIAFLSGGALAIAAQFVMMAYQTLLGVDEKTAISMTVVTVILITAILTGLGIYDKFAQVCGAGSVLTYGIASAFVFGMIRFILFGG